MSVKEKYIKYCETAEVPLFFQPKWLDGYEHPWNVVEATIIGYHAYWVYHLEKKLTFKFIRNPHLTPYTGLICCDNLTPSEIQSELAFVLMNQLPTYDVMELDLGLNIASDSTFNNSISSLKRTNLLSLENVESLYLDFKSSLQRQIKKASKSLHVIEKNDIRLLYKLHSKTFEKQGKKPSIPLNVFEDYWRICQAHHCGKLYFIVDQFNNVHAGLWLAYDSSTGYYLAGGTDHSYYGSGAMSLLMWHAIQESGKMNLNTFDFEGSMLPNVDRFFKNFNPIEKQYIHLKHVKSKLYRLIK